MIYDTLLAVKSFCVVDLEKNFINKDCYYRREQDREMYFIDPTLGITHWVKVEYTLDKLPIHHTAAM